MQDLKEQKININKNNLTHHHSNYKLFQLEKSKVFNCFVKKSKYLKDK